MLMIRFQRIGRRHDPAFRIVLTERARAAQTGNIVEQLGTYNPKSKALTLNDARVKEWIDKGAQPSDSVRNLLITKSILEGKKVNVLPKKSPIKKEQETKTEAKAEAAVPAAGTDVVTDAATPVVEEAISETDTATADTVADKTPEEAPKETSAEISADATA